MDNYFAFLRNDLLFKLVFSHEELLKALLSCVLDIPEEHITELAVGNSEIPSDEVGVKTARLDIQVSFKILGEHTLCDVEMQVIVGSDFPKRVSFYIHRMQERDLKVGSDYSDIRKAVGIFFLLENIFKSPNYHNIGVQKLLDTNEIVEDNICMHYVELQKIDFSSMDIKDNDTKMLLLKLLKADTREELSNMETVHNAMVQTAIGYMNTYNADPKTRSALQAREDFEIGLRMSLQTKYAEGRAEEREIANKELHEQNIKTAKILLKQNLSLDVIAAASHLNADEIEKLRS